MGRRILRVNLPAINFEGWSIAVAPVPVTKYDGNSHSVRALSDSSWLLRTSVRMVLYLPFVSTAERSLGHSQPSNAYLTGVRRRNRASRLPHIRALCAPAFEAEESRIGLLSGGNYLQEFRAQ